MLPTVAKRPSVSVHVDCEVSNIVFVDAVGFPNELDIVQGNVIPELVSFFISPLLHITADLHIGF